MKVVLNDIGVLKYAEFTLGDFTILCGKNNTGKTYATYSLYGFLDYWNDSADFGGYLSRELLQRLSTSHHKSTIAAVTKLRQGFGRILNSVRNVGSGRLITKATTHRATNNAKNVHRQTNESSFALNRSRLK